ncbi:MAG: hypothetical protein ABSG46_17055 [Candidatus Binataceae bacterium]|jgi:hypothetical protein
MGTIPHTLADVRVLIENSIFRLSNKNFCREVIVRGAKAAKSAGYPVVALSE